MYIAYLCFAHPYPEDEEPSEAVVEFTEPYRYKYEKVVPIAFEVLKDFDAERFRPS